MIPTRKSQLKSKIQLLLACLVFILLITITFVNIQKILQISVIWVENLGIWGPVAFIIIYNLATLLFIPGSLLTLKGGCLFGLFWGSIYVLIAAMLGAVLAFIIGRYLCRDYICKQLQKYPKFNAIDQSVAKEGWKIVLLTRLSPLFPFNLLNYAFGVTNVALKDYILGSLGIIPGTLLYVYIGSLATNLAMISTNNQPSNSTTGILQFLMQMVGLIATIMVSFYITKLAQKSLNQSIIIAEKNQKSKFRNQDSE